MRPEHHTVIVVGGGQAGLSVSHGLKERGIDHVIFEARSAGYAWRELRWDTFCLVTPNWQCQLPGFPYAGDDPDGFMKKDQIVRYLEDYVAWLSPPLREGVKVTRIARGRAGGFVVDTSAGAYTSDAVVMAVGNYHVPKIPAYAAALPASIVQMHASQYKNPEALPDGAVLVVGTGQSGCQIAEDLHLAGRKVHLCVGGAPRVARRYRGRDVVAWLSDMGHYDLPVEQHPLKEDVRKKANHYVTGRDGGRDIDLRVFARDGMQLHGRLLDIQDGVLQLGDDLTQNLDRADESNEKIKRSIDEHIARAGLSAPEEPAYTPVWRPDLTQPTVDVQTAGIGSVIWSIGYRSDFGFVDVPVFDDHGYPRHVRGVTPIDGMYFLGLPWLHTWGSGRFSGIARDARHVVERIALSTQHGAQALEAAP